MPTLRALHAALTELASRVARCITLHSLADGNADALLQLHLAALSLAPDQLLSSIPALLQRGQDSDDIRTLVLLRVALVLAEGVPLERREAAVRHVFLPILGAETATSVSPVVLDVTCEAIAKLVTADAIPGLWTAAMSALQSTVTDEIACQGAKSGASGMTAVAAASLALRLHRLSPTAEASAALAAAGAQLSLSPLRAVRAASLSLLCSSDLDVGASAVAVWGWLARGCASESEPIRLHCFTTAAALHEQLRGAWRAALEAAPMPSAPPTPNALLMHALRRDGANRTSQEAKAAAFIVSTAHAQAADAAAWETFLAVYGSLEAAYDIHLIQPVWPTQPSWWLGDVAPLAGTSTGTSTSTNASTADSDAVVTSPSSSRPSSSREALEPPPSWPWIELLLRRAFGHANVAVRYWAALTLLEHVAAALEAPEPTEPSETSETSETTGPAAAEAHAVVPPERFMAEHLLPLLLHSHAPWRADLSGGGGGGDGGGGGGGGGGGRNSGDDAGDGNGGGTERGDSNGPLSPLAAAVRDALPLYVSYLARRAGVEAACAWVESLLRACQDSPKVHACEHLLTALASTPEAPGVLSQGGFHALRDVLQQAGRSHGRVAQARLWRVGLKALLALGDAASLGLLPIMAFVRSAPAAHRLPQRAVQRVRQWLERPRRADGGAWLEAELAEAVQEYLERYTNRRKGVSQGGAITAAITAAITSPITAQPKPFLPAASDLSDSAEEAETLRAACDLCPTAQRVALALGPLCAQLVNVHTRAYLHPLHAPRLLVLLHALIDGAAAADEPAWRAVVINMLSGCAEGCCGVVENALSEARTGRSDSSLVGAPDQTDWLCARVAHCSGALAACTAAVPEVRSIVTFVGEQLLQGLSTELASAAGPQAPRVRLMAADALSAVVRAGLYGARAPDSAHDGAPGIVAVHPLLAKPMQSAREAMLAACAEGAGRLTSMDGDGNGVDLRLRYRSEVAQWAALAALLDAAGDAPSVAIVSGRSSPPPPIRVREGIATAVAHDLELVDRRHQTWLASCVAALKQSSGDAEALHALLRCAGPLIRNALRHSVVDGAAVTDGAVSSVSSTVSSVSSTVSHIRALHRACLESLRLVGSTALQPSLCAAVANALLSVPVLHCTGLQAESFGAFDFLHGLGAARPFAAQLAASRLCDAVLEQPRACLPWASRIHELLLHGDAALPVCSTALLSTLDDDLAPRLSTRAVTSVSRADLAAAVPADSQSTAATCNLASTTSAAAAPVVDGCATAEDEGIQALLDALMAGGADAQRRAAAHRVRALALRLLLELPLRAESLATGASNDGALALLNAVTALLLDSVASPDASFPKWYLPQTQGARRCLRSWQALSLLAPRLPELGAPAQAAASCVWRLLSEKPLPRVRQYMESVAVALVLSDARSAPTVLCNFVADPTLSRDAAASAVLIVGAALVALPLDSRQAAMNTVLPHLLGWATCTFHTARLLSIGVLSRLAALAPDATITDDLDAAASMRRTPAAAARTDVDTPAVAPSATDGDGARDGALAPPALLATLGSFFATQPQIVAATAAIDPLLWLPAHSPSASAALYDARGAALAAGAGDGESAPVSTLERLGRQMSALVHASKEEETAVLQKEASERRLALTEYLRGQLAALRVSTASSLSSAPVSSAPVSSAPVSSAPVSSAPVSSAPVSSAPVSSAPAGIEPLLAPAAASPAPPLLAPAAASPVAPATSRAAHQVAQRKTALGGHGWWSVEPLVLDVLSAAAAADEEADEEVIGRNRRQSGAESDEAIRRNRRQSGAESDEAIRRNRRQSGAESEEAATAASGALEDEGAASHAASFTPMHAQLADLRTTAVQSKRRAHELIVVASLLDKPTNLGGICRSAEIFGAAALVLPDKRLASHEAFKGLSMGAERWLPMEEVKPAELSRYLRARRAAGWRIVALEQAAGSVPLQEYYSTLGAHDDAEEASTTHPTNELAYQYDFEPGKHIGLGLGDHASGAIVVNDVVDGTLAQQKGIIIGMTLRAVNGQSMAGMKKDDALNLVRSIPPGAARRLTFTNELLTQAAPIRRSRGRSPRALEKTVLLLGAEGTGVPASLLAEVDQCVEIPQRGLLRSLNVHVSAAIAMWEHARAAG